MPHSGSSRGRAPSPKTVASRQRASQGRAGRIAAFGSDGATSGIFPSDYRAILAAGEAGGVTGQVLKQIAELLARRLEIRSKIASALVYPMILILMSLVSVVVIVFVLIPSISPIFVDAGLPLPGILHFFEEVAGQLAERRCWLLGALRRSGLRVVGQGEAKSRDHARGRPVEMLVAGDWQIDPTPRSRRLCAGARHAARSQGCR